jgi:hypothetical protein
MELSNNDGEKIQVLKTKDVSNDWDIAHKHLDESMSKEFFEPDIESTMFEEQVSSIKLKSSENGYLQSWPQPKETKYNLVWYLNDNFSQLRRAKNEVINKVGKENCRIKIAIIDTGYQEGHPALPKGFDTPKGISFIKGEENKPAIDKNAATFAEQNGHGTATMSILAGKEVDIQVSGQSYKGEFGAIPFAEIIPIRICETVALIRTSAFVDAVEYAINQGCEVISMSMAGVPTKAWATTVNKAYENGVVLVSAAGNSWYKGAASLSPKRLLYPARWDRVIAATGVTYNKLPYVMEAQIKEKGGSSEYMQGNFGPESAMKSALAAYTPNTTWATLNDKNNPFRINGGGTSSATPQIAAAAALWIVRYRREIDALLKDRPIEKWKKVEMVKNALFNTSDNSYNESRKYFGQGTLKSFDALSIAPSVQGLKKANEATVSLWGILDLLGLLLRMKNGKNEEMVIRGEMFGVEILQELHNNPNLHKFLNYEETYIWSPEEKDELKRELLASNNISTRLKEYFLKE